MYILQYFDKVRPKEKQCQYYLIERYITRYKNIKRFR